MLAIGRYILYELSTQLAGGDATSGTFGKATVSIVGFFGAIQKVAVTCGVAAAVCAVLLVAILIVTSNNPHGREQAKGQMIAIATGCAALATAGSILAVAANIGASF